MTRPRPPHLHREVTRHGKALWYFRVAHGPRVRMPDEYGSPAFLAAYTRALTGGYEDMARPGPGPKKGTLEWLVAEYRKSADWRVLSRATRRQRENILLHVLASAGATPFLAIRRETIAKGRDNRAATPFAARHFMQTMRGLFRWASDAGHVTNDPTAGVKVTVPQTKGFPVWTEAEIAKFEARWPIGTRERLALAIMIFTGLRRGDVARLGPQHVCDGVISIETEKTRTPVNIPMLPELAAIIEATPTGTRSFLATAGGAPYTKESLGNWFKDACKTAGVQGSAHGLRKAGATRAANNGATVAQLEAIFGWSGGRMASLYTRTADRTRLARDAMEKLKRG